MGKSNETGLGKLKVFLACIQTVVGIVAAISKFNDTGHAILSTFIFAFFIVYVVADVLYWRSEVAIVWVTGPITILVAAYWWVGFLAIHHIPSTPFMPASFYPPQWAYIAMFGWLALYCAWEIIDARVHEYRDEWLLVIGAVILLAGASLCLYLTLKGPQGF